MPLVVRFRKRHLYAIDVANIRILPLSPTLARILECTWLGHCTLVKNKAYTASGCHSLIVPSVRSRRVEWGV